ncbi:MAG TPA: class I SAM-dependent methyltransferase [Thermotogota bacterium]|nr:class I SAM-dependent methyltransferase [Thermotogota bacterium]HRW93118.1 class I SAM-dependent methyltransferase [Thermotogota bacterium]
MGLGWIAVDQLPVEVLLLLERKHLQWIVRERSGQEFGKFHEALGTVFLHHPSIRRFFQLSVPDARGFWKSCMDHGDWNASPHELRQAEVFLMELFNDWMVYVVDPGRYDELALGKWDDKLLLDLADFSGKRVVDIGSGTGRLALVAAPVARVVYAVEPVARLREFLLQKARDRGLRHFFTVDGYLEDIPFESDFADITMAGHVFGDVIEEEYSEMMRVTRNGGQIILFPGNNDLDNAIHRFLGDRGFCWKRFEEPGEGFKRAYWTTVQK